MASNYEELLPKLVEAIQVVMNPGTSQSQRHEAYQACEDFKENSPLCVQCGLALSMKQYDQFVRHFGLQLLEHSIKFRWNDMSGQDKLFIKENTMKLMAEGTNPMLVEEAHIKDALSRIVVEMVKREWPQHWPELLGELAHLAKFGWAQAELVLLIFRRLAEDVVAFQSLPNQRRREILTMLTREMSGIYNFFLDQLVECFRSYLALKAKMSPQDESSVASAQEAAYICRVILDTLSVYVEWIAMSHILERDSLLLVMLCTMLQEDPIQLAATECLLLIVNRKGKLEDRKPLLVMFESNAMQAILDAATKSGNAPLEDNHYLFLKRLCQVLVAMGMQLNALWGTSEKVERPSTFHQYLDAMLAFTSHHSQILSSYTQSLWSMLFRHEDIKKDPVLLSIVPRLLEIIARMLCKVGLPSSQNNHPSCVYAKYDFDSDDDFNMFFSKYRAEVAECLRFITLAAPVEAFKAAAAALHLQLKRPLDIGGGDSEHCKLKSPSFIEWDALSVFVESVMMKVTALETKEQFVTDGICLLNNLLQYDTKDPLILSCVLSCISALFPYITHEPNILPMVLDKIFCTAVFRLAGQTKATRSRAVRNVRRHACSILIKLSKAYPTLLLPGFDQLYQHIKSLSSDPEELSHLEKVTLMEALVLISNQFQNFEKQSAFIGEILTETRDFWLSEQLKTAICSAERFMAYVGLDQPPVEPSSADTCGINRSQLMHGVNVILAVMKRSQWPRDTDAAKAGGFVVSTTSTGGVIFQSPAAKHLLGMLDHVFVLARILNEIWLPEHLARRHPDFVKAYDLTDMEKMALLGITPPSVDNTSSPHSKQPVERMQAFLTTVSETCCHIVGNVGLCLGSVFYQAPKLASFINNSYLANLDAVPDFRLRHIIRSGLKSFIQCCPKDEYHSAVMPILEVLGPYMYQRLNNKWQTMDQKTVEVEEEDENPVSDEVINSQLVRLLSREYLEFIASVFRERRGSALAEVPDDMVMDEAATENQATQRKDDSISELGVMVFKSESTFSSLVMTLFSGLCWSDSTICNRCTLLCWPVLKHLLTTNKLTGADACHLFKSILMGMHYHGQHDATQAGLVTLGLQAYENMREKFPEVATILMQIPNMTEVTIQQFDDKIQGSAQAKQIPEKRKKDLFKKLIQDIIGKNVGQQFKKEVHIKNLPPLIKASKPQVQPLEDSENLGLCSLFIP